MEEERVYWHVRIHQRGETRQYTRPTRSIAWEGWYYLMDYDETESGEKRAHWHDRFH